MSDSPRILHAPLNIAGGPEALSAGLNAIGCESRLMVFTKQPFRDGSDINLHLRQGGGPVNLALNLPKQAWAFGRSIPDYDIFQFHFGVTIVPKRVNLPVLGKLGKGRVFHFWGSDLRDAPVSKWDYALRHADAAVVGSYAILWLQTSRGFRHMEAVITGLLGIIIVGFVVQVILAGPNGVDVAEGLFIPGFDGTESVLLAAGILGATVMPHVIYLHSALTKPRAKGRSEEERSRLIRFERIDVVIAMAIAGLVNMSMLIVAAAAFHSRGLTDVVDLEEVHALLGPILGGSAPVLFALALLASGLSSSSVGTLAGQVIMEGFIHRRIPLWLRRGITMAPAIAIIAIGVNPTRALIISQVVLSFGIPFALIPLILASRDRGLMGRFRLGTRGLVAAVLVACVILALNVFLLGKLALG